ncbi:MAG: PEP-CTERM-box response regulator transcription factor [Rhodospirillaceae bacterium]|nr:PEP-CTERM-box response regulator transcription factor [Rhodospirillaceae bacterium]
MGETATAIPAEAPTRDLLVVEDDAGLQSQMRWAMSNDFVVHVAGDRSEALNIMERHRPSLVVLDLGLPPDPDGATEGLGILDSILAEYPGTKIVVASGNEDRNNAIKAVSFGAYDFFGKPVDIDQLRLILERAWQLHVLEEENRRLTCPSSKALDGIIAASSVMLDVCRVVERVAPTDVSLLIMGESGTGKEMFARAVHNCSGRVRGPFVAVNCAAIPENLLESELFGYERGAFTGAVRQTKGKVEQAKNGTLFLDEIGDMPMALQAKLLRFLQNRTFQRLGGREDITVDLRIVSATNRNLAGMIAQGGFREDLFFRLNEVCITVPPLREREGDALVLAHTFLHRFAESYRKGRMDFSQGALVALSNYAWPGNVRELENRIKRAVVLAQDNRITPADLGLADSGENDAFVTLRQARRKAEVDAIQKALASCHNNLSRAAKILGVSRPTLYSLLAAYDIRAAAK